MALFDTWDTVELEVHRSTGMINRIRMHKYNSGPSRGNKVYRRFNVSKNLIVESGAERFILKTKGGTYALVPSENGPLYYKDGRIGGLSHYDVENIVEKLGTDDCQASVIDGAIVFPIKDNFIS